MCTQCVQSTTLWVLHYSTTTVQYYTICGTITHITTYYICSTHVSFALAKSINLEPTSLSLVWFEDFGGVLLATTFAYNKMWFQMFNKPSNCLVIARLAFGCYFSEQKKKFFFWRASGTKPNIVITCKKKLYTHTHISNTVCTMRTTRVRRRWWLYSVCITLCAMHTICKERPLLLIYMKMDSCKESSIKSKFK